MLSDNVFRSRLEATVASLSYWAPTIKNAARIETTDDATAWRMQVTPHLRSACPLEISIRTDQKFDLKIAGETFTDLPLESFEIFLPIAEAVAEGRVVRRAWLTPSTGSEHTIETIVQLPGGKTWRAGRVNEQIARLISREDCIREDHSFPPYHRV